MFPWVYGFEHHTGYLIFLGIFFSVAVVVVATLILALMRAIRDFRRGQAARIEWLSNFHDLPTQDRACRHALTGELCGRVCDNGFDCRSCAKHAEMTAPPAPCADNVCGIAIDPHLFYHRGHTWVRVEADGACTVGLDEFARRVMGRPDSLELPQPGAALTANAPCATLRRRGSAVRLLAPIDGVVAEVAPAGADWLFRVQPQPQSDMRHLLSGIEVKAWYLRELERLQIAMGFGAAAPSLADGGVLVDDLAAVCPKSQWDAVCGEIFLNA